MAVDHACDLQHTTSLVPERGKELVPSLSFLSLILLFYEPLSAADIMQHQVMFVLASYAR
jgi:hypothetical protein